MKKIRKILAVAICFALLFNTVVFASDKEVKVQFRYLQYEYKRIMKDCIMLNFPSSITNSYETGKE